VSDFVKELEDKHDEALSYAKRYTRLLIIVIGAFALLSILMKYGSDIVGLISPTNLAEVSLAHSSQPNGYWTVQSISQIGLAILAIYFGQVIATYSKYFYKKANYYERLLLVHAYSVSVADSEIFQKEFLLFPKDLGIGEFPKNPMQYFTEAVKSRSGGSQEMHNKASQQDKS
jgi:hypothetical protein